MKGGETKCVDSASLVAAAVETFVVVVLGALMAEVAVALLVGVVPVPDCASELAGVCK